ncbi:pilus assembly protein TadG-related protein [Laribacter hongkongensis]|uniref:TadE/TadG family type IV pilus assembly protein n=1 Tax=Laribacter hongkongensis TaxID=168471 RepID=UPI001EFDF02A|nr:TadE/TadG family type IV pilus assembly protein [Laribacter hongkongensis]MCG9063746.1 pilus assembly protein TadG-related protein [Laribacter hongkongensis]
MIPTTVRRQTGSVTLVFLFSTVVVTLSLLAAIDIMRYNLVQSRLQSALDAAVLAAGRNLGNQPGQSGTEAWKADARAYLQANMPNGYLGSNYDISKVTISVTGDNKTGQTLKMSATGELPLLVAGFLSTKELPLSAANQAVRSSRRDLELVLVLDNTGSMQGTRLRDLKSAANTLVDTLFGEDSGNDASNFYIGLIPFSHSVNVRNANGEKPLNWIKNRSYHPFQSNAEWSGCISDPAGSLSNPPKVLNPADRPFTAYFSVEDVSTKREDRFQFGNDYCINSVTTFLTNNKSTITNGIAAMQANGGTVIPGGAIWGWRMLSPSWRGENGWGSITLPQDKQSYLTKAMIIMTDGANGGLSSIDIAKYNTFGTPDIKTPLPKRESGGYYKGDLNSYITGNGGANLSPYGNLYNSRGSYSDSIASQTLNRLLVSTCQAARNDGIKIWTITFGDDANSQEIKSTMQSCASEAYYHAPGGDQLKEIFKNIAGQLSELRLVQ